MLKLISKKNLTKTLGSVAIVASSLAFAQTPSYVYPSASPTVYYAQPTYSSQNYSSVGVAQGAVTYSYPQTVAYPSVQPTYSYPQVVAHPTATYSGSYQYQAQNRFQSTTVATSGAEQQILAEVNAIRARAGLQPLQLDPTLTQSCQVKSQAQIGRGLNLSHKAAPIAGMAENIAYNPSGSASGAMQQWMNSPGHRANILNPNYRYLGVGATSGYFTQQFR